MSAASPGVKSPLATAPGLPRAPAHAMACTDWKAIAAFDAVIAANDRIAAPDEATHYYGGCQQIEKQAQETK
jgi:hypothetical protein